MRVRRAPSACPRHRAAFVVLDVMSTTGERMDEMEEIMKLVKCIVRTHKVEETTDALKQIDVSGVTVTQVGGRGRRAQPQGSLARLRV